MTLRISPSILSSFEYWKGNEFSEETEKAKYDELVSQIKGEPFEESEALLVGKAWHAALEAAVPANADTVTAEGYSFFADGVLEVQGEQPAGLIREIAGELALPEIDVVMGLRADGIAGNIVHEVKTTSRIDPEKYVQTAQWRAYLLAFDAAVVTYHVCRLLQDRKTGIYRLKEYVPFQQYRYKAMRSDLVERVVEVRDFIIDAGLAEFRAVKEERCA